MTPARFPNGVVVTYGRSGSTLLQGVLNGIPGYLVRGENEDLAGHLLKMVDAVSTQHYPKTEAPTSAWFGAKVLNRPFLVQCARQLIDRVLLEGETREDLRSYGFKEIRYPRDDVEQKVRFLEEMYPGCAIIFNTRNPADVVGSEFQIGEQPDYFAGLNERFAALANDSATRFVVAYEDVRRMTGSLLDLFAFLGEEFDRDATLQILRRKHSYHTAVTAYRSAIPFFAQVCREGGRFQSVVIHSVASEGERVRLVAHLISATGAADAFAEANGRPLEVSLEPLGKGRSLSPEPGGARERLVVSLARPEEPGAEIDLLYDDAPLLKVTNLDKLP